MLRSKWLQSCAASVALLTAQATIAATPTFCPTIGSKPGGKVDDGADVEKDLLAGAALDKAALPRPLERRLRGINPLPNMTFWTTIVALGTNACIKEDGSSVIAGAVACSAAERSSLGSAQIAAAEYLEQTDKVLLKAPDSDLIAFLSDPSRTLRCKPPKDATDGVETKGSKKDDFWSPTHVRVRGSASDLIYLQKSSAYASADKAKLDFGDDREAGKRSTKFVGAIGYAIPFLDYQTETKDHVVAGIVPYFGVNIDTSRMDGEDRKVESNVLELGSVFEYRHISTAGTSFASFANYASATPKLLLNRDDDSRLAGFDLLYRPSFNVLNSLHPIGDTGLFWNVIGDIRLNNGIWLRRGDRPAIDTRDFSRLGGRFGIGLATKGKLIPAELTITDTYLITLAGEPGHLSLFKSDLTLYFNEDKNFGVDIAYSRGRFQDLDPRVHGWTVGFAVKY